MHYIGVFFFREAKGLWGKRNLYVRRLLGWLSIYTFFVLMMLRTIPKKLRVSMSY